MKEIDARGRSCPEPVLMLKKELTSNASEYIILVDNHAAKENVTRFARHAGCQVDTKQTGSDYILTIKK